MSERGEHINVAEHFLTDRVREGRGGRVALRLDDRNLTYDEVEALANRYASALVGLDVRPEERVLLALADGPDFVGALFGVLKVGAVAVMVNPHLQPEAFATIAGYSRARLAVVDDDGIGLVAAVPGLSEGPLSLLTVGSDNHGHAAFADLVTDDRFDAVATHPDDPAMWLFSGGTTGAPKAVVQTHGSFANTTRLYAQAAVGYTEDDVTISVPKLYFGYATGCNLFFPFSVGASAVLFAERSTPSALASRIVRHRASILVNVPSMMHALVDAPDVAAEDLSSLRFCTSAGEALPPALYDRWRERFGVEVLDGLGTAEMWHIFVSNVPGDVRPGTLGRPVPGFRVEIRDDEGSPVPTGEVGQLWVAGASRGIGYWRNLAKTSQVFRGEWVVTGDLVREDEDGYLRYIGRGDDAIKVKGKWLVPAEVEGVLASHPAVTGAVVVGAVDGAGLLKPAAFVTIAEPRLGLVEELQALVIERLDAYKHPRTIEIVDELPRTHYGKVDRAALKTRASERARSSSSSTKVQERTTTGGTG